MNKFSRILIATLILLVISTTSSFARSSHGASGGDLGQIFVLGVVLVVGLIFAVINANKTPEPASQEQLDQLRTEAKEFFDKINSTGKITIPDTPVIMGADEKPLLNEASRLIEGRATRLYAGGGTRVGGIYLGGGESSSFQTLKELDSGTLTLTTKRLVFTGSMESRITEIKGIVSVETFADAVEIGAAKRTKRQTYVVRNPLIWSTFIRTVINGGVSFDEGDELKEPLTVSDPTENTPQPQGDSQLRGGPELPKPQPVQVQQELTTNPTSDSGLQEPGRSRTNLWTVISIGLALVILVLVLTWFAKGDSKTPQPSFHRLLEAASASLPQFVMTRQPISIGADVVPAGTRLELVSKEGSEVHIRYRDGVYGIPISATDLK